MSSFLTPKRRDRVKQRSATVARTTAQSMSPSIQRSSSLSSESGSGSGNHASGNDINVGGNNNVPPTGGTSRGSSRSSHARTSGYNIINTNNNSSKYHPMNEEDSPPSSNHGSPARNITITSRHVGGSDGSNSVGGGGSCLNMNLNTSMNSYGTIGVGSSSSNIPPRTVTPTGGLASVSRSSSWEDYDEGFYQMGGSSSSSHPRHSNNNNNKNTATTTTTSNGKNTKVRAPLSPGRLTSAFRQQPRSSASVTGIGSGSMSDNTSPKGATTPNHSMSNHSRMSQSFQSGYDINALPSLHNDDITALDDSFSRDDDSVGDNNNHNNGNGNINIKNNADDDDMPMDERMDVKKSFSFRQPFHFYRTKSYQSGTSQDSHHEQMNAPNTVDTTHNQSTLVVEDSCSAATYRTVTPTKVSEIVTMSPSGDSCVSGGNDTGWARMIDALKSGSTSRPPRLSQEECILWDALQTAMANDRNEHLSKRRDLERHLQESAYKLNEVSSRETDLQLSLAEAQQEFIEMKDRYETGLSKYRALAATALSGGTPQQQQQGNEEVVDVDRSNTGLDESDCCTTSTTAIQEKVEYLERTVKEQESAIQQQQAEHDAAVRAIQRVLADVTAEKTLLEEQMEEHHLHETQVRSLNETETTFDSQSEIAEREISIISTNERQHDATATTLSSVGSGGDNNNQHQSKEIKLLRDELKLAEQEKQNAKREAEKKARRVLVLERDIKVNKTQLNNVMEEKTALAKEVEASKGIAEGQRSDIEVLKAQMRDLENEVVAQKKRNELLHAEIRSLKKARDDALKEVEVANSAANAAKEAAKAAKDAVMIATNDDSSTTAPRELKRAISEGAHDTKPKMSPDDIEKLQRNLADTTSSLENAKKIIASLENANGALALDLRAKLKGKEEELSISQKEAEERKRRLDSLATDLRDLQRRQGDFEKADQLTKAQVIKQKALVGHLENSLSDLQSAVAVHEASTESSGLADSSGMDEISEILGDTLYAVKVTIEATEQFVDEIDEMSVVNSDIELSSEVGRHIDAIVRNDREATAQDYRVELDQKKVAVKRLEEALKKQNEEMRKLRSQLESRARGSGESDEQLRAEIQNLRQQCSTNMEVLAKKERELSVLRSSLKVDDNETGYISDDGSDDDDNDEEGDTTLPPAKLTSYGPAEAEALATILSQTSGGIDLSSRNRELEYLKKELLMVLGEKENAAKELRSERESLANAKMIISSLEKANKGMMEDLRSRLQDSNTAIASLLDKSMEHERNSDLLREEVEKLNQKRVEDQQKHEAEVARLMQQINISAGRGERELAEHRNEFATEETPSEEKKEDSDVPICL